MTIDLRQGDCLDVMRTMPDRSVHTCVTSPPYFGLRDYGADGQIGLEATPDIFVAKMVEVFREVRRLLRNDGTLWLNLGDSYSSSPSNQKYDWIGGSEIGMGRTKRDAGGLAPKQLIGIPWRVAFALQADGWYLRSDIIWHKPNPMPESVRDRPTKAHEYLFLLSKSERYFYDADAIKEPSKTKAGMSWEDRKAKGPGKNAGVGWRSDVDRAYAAVLGDGISRNRRSVWTVATRPFKGAHFATFPPMLIEPCILAGTSEAGCCPECGTPWERVRTPSERYAKFLGKGFTDHSADLEQGMMQNRGVNRQNAMLREGITSAEYVTTGFRPACSCDAGDAVPCTVLDPFNGAGTTGVVAKQHGRSYVGIELNPEYLALADTRIEAA